MTQHTLRIYDQNRMPIYTKLVAASYGQIKADFPGPHDAEYASYYTIDNGPITPLKTRVKLKPDEEKITFRVVLDAPRPAIEDAQPGDVYVDEHGILWSIVGLIREPAIVARRMIVSGVEDDKHEKIVGGVSGTMWDGFKRIYRSGE